jgi:4-hydroxy-tetrahydrodipicolinate synthase
MSPRRAPHGIISALITPFDDHGSVDRDALERVVEAQLVGGVHGLFLLGTTGEGPLLDPDERRELTQFVVKLVAGRLPVVVHCGAADTRTASGLARHAQDLGVEGVATIGPYYFQPDPESLVRHFVAVAEAAPEISHYVYENPGQVGYAIGVESVARLVREVPNIVGVKDTGDTIGKITEYRIRPDVDIDVYVGNNSTILPALVVGAVGSVSAMANAVPELVSGIHGSWTAGDLDEARRRQFSLARLVVCLQGAPFVSAVKHLVERRGLPAGGMRAPLRSITADEAALIDARIESFGDELLPWLGHVSGARRVDASG